MFIEICAVLAIIFIVLALLTFISNWGNGPATDLTHSMKDKVVVIT